ncbi:AAA family ATPase [Gordonia hankookensis]|uniref:AAA family ATPase n=1 Tax=Gordonia hankookensis TaxID=589403 RepID=A0ABR7W6S8_9ACTN|nr:AAA family ATPase [Gordonia hankookensis]MBD1318530.1 AAA family ATPase [Gordonia hankookensis]
MSDPFTSAGPAWEPPTDPSDSAERAIAVPGPYAADCLTAAEVGEPARAALRSLEWVNIDALRAEEALNPALRVLPTVGDIDGWCRRHGINPTRPAPNGKVDRNTPVHQTEVRLAVAGVGVASRFAISDLIAAQSESGAEWIERALAWVRESALSRDAMRRKTTPTEVALTDLFGFGASIDELAALPTVTPAARVASARLLMLWKQVEYERARQDARAALASEKVRVIELPAVTGLDELLSGDDPEVIARIDRLWPEGGARILLAAAAKFGKTTLVYNLVRSWADGDEFLGAFAVRRPAERIVIVDTEMSRAMVRKWLRSQQITNTEAVVDVICLRGQAGLFDLRNDALRARWAVRLADLGCDMLIFDCLKPVLDALGLSEGTETGMFTEPFDELLHEAGIADALMVTHMGHGMERARGDSSLLGRYDGNWRGLRPDPLLPTRFFAAEDVRDMADDPVAEGQLTFDPATLRLSYVGGDRRAHANDTAAEARMQEMLNVLADDREAHSDDDDYLGMLTTDLRDAVGGKKETLTAAIRLAESRDLLHITRRGRATYHRLADEARDPLNTGTVIEGRFGGFGDTAGSSGPPAR